MLSYTVNRAFGWEGVFYTRENADEIKQLPREVRDQFIASGAIEEHGGSATASAPTTTRKGEK